MYEKQYSDDTLLIEKKKLIIIPRDLEEPLDNDEKNLIKTFKDFLEKKTYIWDTSGAKEYRFHLPKTYFFEEKKMNFQIFEEFDVIYDESYTSDKLKDDQLSEIWKNGQFSVKSRQMNVPYVWQLSTWLHKGRKNINSSFSYDMSLSFESFYYLKNRFHYCKDHQIFNIQGSIKFFFIGVKEIFGLFFGMPRYTLSYMNILRNPDNYLRSRAIEKYQKNLLAEHPDIVTSIYYRNAQSIIKKIESDMMKGWDKEKLIIENKLSQQNLTPKEIKHNIAELRIERLIDAFEKSPKLSNKNKTAIIDLIKSEHIYQKIKFDYNEKLSAAEKLTKERILEEYPVRSQVEEWYNKEYNSRIEIEKKILEEEMDYRIEKEFDEYPIHRAMIKSYKTFMKNLNENYKEILQIEKKTAYDKFVINVYYNQPNPVEKRTYSDYRGQDINEYSFKYCYPIHTETSYPFWRITLTFQYIYTSILNILMFCYNHCWNNSFGLKALCASEIVTTYSINGSTGEVKPSSTSFTLRSSLRNVFNSISNSRSSFLNAQDIGFLGSKLGNAMNWMENYIFRLIFGLILVGILYPVFILLYTAIMLVFTVIAIVAATLFFIILTVFINVFIYDFWETNYNNCACLPIVWIIFKRFILHFAFNLLITLLMMIFQMIAGVFMIFFGIFRWLLRSLYDLLTFQIIRCNAKIPKANTPFAWRIAGPGISRTLFYKLEVEDALLLVKANLEKLDLSNYHNTINDKLREPFNNFENVNKRVLNHFNATIEMPSQILESINRYTNALDNQVSERRKIYPVISQQVRFTRTDLDLLLEATYDIVRDYVKDNPQMEFIWERFKLVPLSWRNLTEKILIDTFNSEDILIDVDDSELKYDPNAKNSKRESEDLYDKLSIGKAKKKADKKMKNLNLFAGGSVSLLEDQEEYYHGNNYRNKRFNQREYDLISEVPQFKTNNIFQNEHHFNIVANTNYFPDNVRYNNESEEDEKLGYVDN